MVSHKSPCGSITATAIPKFISCTTRLAINEDFPCPVMPVISLCVASCAPWRESFRNGGVVVEPRTIVSFILKIWLFLRKLATLPSAFRGSGFSYKVAWYQHFSSGGLLCLSVSLFSALRHFML